MSGDGRSEREEPRRVTCIGVLPNGQRCTQVLATVSARGSVHPVIIGAYFDREGRSVIVCPVCHKENRLPVRRRAA